MNNFVLSIHFLHGGISLICFFILIALFITVVFSNRFEKEFRIPMGYVVGLDLVWSFIAVFEQLPAPYITEEARYWLYIAGAFCWVQYGYAIILVTSTLTKTKIHHFWNAWNLIGIIYLLLTGVTKKFYTGVIETWYGFTATNDIIAIVAILAFMIVPVAFSAYIALKSLKGAEEETKPIFREIFVILTTAIFGGLIMDAILPAFNLFIYGESAAIFLFFVTIVLCHASLSISHYNISVQQATQLIIQQLDEGVIILNEQGEIEMVNPAACAIFSVRESSLLHKSIFPYLPELKSLNNANSIPFHLSHGDNEITVAVSISSHTAYGVIRGYKLILRDISHSTNIQERYAKLQAEIRDERSANSLKMADLKQKYQEQQIFLRSLLNNLPLRLWAKNLQGVYTQQNRHDIEERGNRANQTDTPKFSKEEQKILSAPQKELIIEETNSDAEGKKHWYKKTILPLFADTNSIEGVLGLIEDTTKVRALEEERNQLKENLAQASKFEDMSNVAGGLAHDFNNILSGIIGYCELAKATLPKDTESEKSDKYLERALKSADSAKSLVQQTFAKLKHEQDKKPQNFDVGIVIDEVKNELSGTLPQNIEIKKESNERIEAFGDTTDFHRILMNLGTNAIFAMKKNGGTLYYNYAKKILTEKLVTNFTTVPPGEYLYLSVKDTGEGISPDILKRIFTPFFTTKSPNQGLGLGLSVTLRLIKASDAYITLETVVGKGTTFELYWPLGKKNLEVS
ncbi:MAG: ATP-binding protein [Fibrobacteraceae bacterium]|nr:ATP-binding protein [Fibrobacteraceae bacterium]